MRPTEHMRIDNRTLIGLNLVEDPSQPGQSVLDILNRTRTPGGCRLLQSWVKQPLIQVRQGKQSLAPCCGAGTVGAEISLCSQCRSRD